MATQVRGRGILGQGRIQGGFGGQPPPPQFLKISGYAPVLGYTQPILGRYPG